MSEERKEGVTAWWLDKNGDAWDSIPDAHDREHWGPFTMEYCHRPPEGAPEPGERRTLKGYAGASYVVRHVYQNFNGAWRVAVTSEKSGAPDEFLLSEWLDLPLAPPKPKYRLAAVELTEEQADQVRDALKRDGDGYLVDLEPIASLLRIEEIPK